MVTVTLDFSDETWQKVKDYIGNPNVDPKVWFIAALRAKLIRKDMEDATKDIFLQKNQEANALVSIKEQELASRYSDIT